MSEKLYEALEVCLEALETGADPGSVLERFPDLEEDLLPLLETSRQAKSLALPAVPETALRRGKARVLQHATQMRASSSRIRKQRFLFSFPRLAVSLAMALVFIFSGTGLVRASGGALPGDQLYSVKRTWEDVRLTLAFNPQSREELENEFHQERLHEVDELLAERRDEPISFTGIVTEQNGDQWVVSGVKVQITSESRLPAVPVTLGTTVFVQGKTNAQGFVEADSIENRGWDLILPTKAPVETETPEDHPHETSPAPGEIDDGHQGEGETGSSPEQDQNQNGSDEKDKQENNRGDNKKNEDGKDSGRSGGEHRDGGRDGRD
jgi:Domain of unknown function (DUF5667)